MGYQRPSATPEISSSWEDHRDRTPPSQEPGTDYPCAYGSSIVAPADGVVVDIQTHNGNGTGRFVTIDLDGGRRVRSLHLSRVFVSVGQRVARGQEVGKSGASAWGKDWGVGAHVHESLWDTHEYRFGPDGTIDFEAHVGDEGTAFDQTVANQQNFLNAAQGENLVVDGIKGDRTREATTRYQAYLQSRGWYDGDLDGDWGTKTQAGHELRYAEWVAQTTPTPNPAFHTATVADLADLRWVNGLQKIAHLYGYGAGQEQSQWMDNIWGDGSKAGLQSFLDQNYGGSLAAWLRAKWGYGDNDDLWGPNMRAAAERAEAANYQEL